MNDPRACLQRTVALIEQGVIDGLHTGAQMFVSRRGEVLADCGLGEARPGVPMQPDTIMLWLSATKPITAVAVAQLWEAGGLELDDPVSRFLPEFSAGGKEGITLRHLLTHTGGFRGADAIPDDLGWEESIERICQAPLEPGWEPGRKAGYQLTSSWLVLGEVVQRLQGRPYERIFREDIFLPLAMADSWIGMPPEVYRRYGHRIGMMHDVRAGATTPLAFWNSEPGCALCRPGSNGRGPIRELGRFYEALLAGLDPTPASGVNRLLRTDTIRALIARQRTGLFDHTFQHIVDFGLGFVINSNRYGSESVPYGYGRHASEDTFGHSGAQSSSAFADPIHGLVVAWVFNGRPGERRHQRRARELNTMIYEDLGLAGIP